ncbi:MAG: SHOCT domain-containing protein [Desulfobulbia bacterium]
MKKLAFLAALFLLVGCGAGKNLSTENRAAIRTVAISHENVILPGERPVSVVGWGSIGAGALGGAVGGLVYDAVKDRSPEEVIWDAMLSDDMLRKVVAEAFQYQFSKAGMWQIAQGSAAEAILYVTPYAIQVVSSGGGYKIVGGMHAEMKNRNGEPVWSDTGLLTAFNSNVKPYQLSTLMADKTQLAKALSVYSQIIAGIMVEDLGGHAAPVNTALGSWSTEPIKEANTGTAESRLRATKDLLEKGLITEEEYQRKKQEIVDSM